MEEFLKKMIEIQKKVSIALAILGLCLTVFGYGINSNGRWADDGLANALTWTGDRFFLFGIASLAIIYIRGFIRGDYRKADDASLGQ